MLTGIWLQDATLGDTVAQIPWINDGVDFDELQFIEMLLGGVGKDLELARQMATHPRFADGVDREEWDILARIIPNIESEPAIANLFLDLPEVQENLAKGLASNHSQS